MKDNAEFKIIAKIRTDFPTKFGIPRQSGLISTLKAKIVFEPQYRNKEALRGLEDFSHLWLLWKFSESVCESWSPTVRPPRLGGNKRIGVFATRSPFRPNPIGLSSVKIERIYDDGKNGAVIEVSGADLMDGTPIYDIKPYIAYTDSHPDASGGFSEAVFENSLGVEWNENTKETLPLDTAIALNEILASDPRPGYKADGERVYSFEYAGYNIKFIVDNKILTVLSVEKV
jgi:tRNA-Thr(GGU) m(6)t(6)A37 methyltransferase TsaA